MHMLLSTSGLMDGSYVDPLTHLACLLAAVRHCHPCTKVQHNHRAVLFVPVMSIVNNQACDQLQQSLLCSHLLAASGVS
jgi:hypothetical protein